MPPGALRVNPFAALITAPLLNGIVGAAIGGTEVVVADFLGKKRGALLWPMVTGAGILAVTGLTTAIIGLVRPAVVDASNPAAALGSIGLSLGISAVGITAAIAVPIVLYQLTAEDKQPGDTGGFPGLLEPARPMAVEGAAPAAKDAAAPPPPAAVPY